jgi:hypothetical protein
MHRISGRPDNPAFFDIRYPDIYIRGGIRVNPRPNPRIPYLLISIIIRKMLQGLAIIQNQPANVLINSVGQIKFYV